MRLNRIVGIAVALVAALVAGLLVLILARTAAGAPVYPPLVGGDFEFRVKANTPLDDQGLPEAPFTRAVAIVPESDTGHIVCVDTPDPNGVYTLTASLTGTGAVQTFKAYAYPSVACSGPPSPASENTAYTFPGMTPVAPDLQ